MKKLYLAQITLLSIAMCTVNLQARTLQQSTKKMSASEKQELLAITTQDIFNALIANLTGADVKTMQMNSILNDLDRSNSKIYPYNPALSSTNEMQSLKDRILVLEAQALKDENAALKNEIELLKQKTE